MVAAEEPRDDEFENVFADLGNPDADLDEMEAEGRHLIIGAEPPPGWSIMGAADGDLQKAMNIADRIARGLLRGQEWLAAYEAAIDARIAELQERKRTWAQRVEESADRLRPLLLEFWREAPKPTKGKKLPLPSGVAIRVRKVAARTSVVKEAALAYCLKDEELEEQFVEWQPKLKTSDFGKRFKLEDDHVVDTQTGEAIEPVTYSIDGQEQVSPLITLSSPPREVVEVIPPKEGPDNGGAD
ncbi:MAG: hypothetical protein J7M26_03105 [Armatimonadetes bacterium]|nr:hypothetical protein [Armatimonadota bacterium]